MRFISGYGPEEYRSGLRRWEVVSAEDDKMEIKLKWVNNFYVGTGPIMCEMQVEFGDRELFKSVDSGVTLAEPSPNTTRIRIVAQLPEDDLTIAAVALAKTLGTVLSVLVQVIIII
jgi:hypothetical protein